MVRSMHRDWKRLQMQKARRVAAKNRTQAPRKRNKCPTRAVTKRRFLKALAGTGGLKTEIAERLGCAYGTVLELLKREDWADVVARYWEEVEQVGDLAEQCVRSAITQRLDLGVASLNARWYLTRKCRDRGYQDASKLVVEGGDKDKPVHVAHSDADVSLEDLDLPLELKRKVLEALERREAERKAKEEGHGSAGDGSQGEVDA